MKVTQRFVRLKHVTETQRLFFPLKHASVCWNYFKQAAEEDASGAIISYYVDLFISRSLFFLFWSTNTERDAFINRKQKACRTESVLQQGTDFALGLMMAEKHGPVLQKNVPAIPSSPTALKYRRHVCSTLWLRTVSGQKYSLMCLFLLCVYSTYGFCPAIHRDFHLFTWYQLNLFAFEETNTQKIYISVEITSVNY